VIAPRTLVRARKPIGYVVHAATGITTNARINTMTMLTAMTMMLTAAMKMLTAVNNLVFNSF